jgi:predicted secreted protein
MTVGTGTLGRKVILKMAGDPIAGVKTKSMTVNNEPVEVTDDDSDGWRELLAEPGTRSVDMGVTGVTKNLELLRAAIVNQSQAYAFEWEFEDGSTITMTGLFTDTAIEMEDNGTVTFTSSFQSSGQPTFTPFIP